MSSFELEPGATIELNGFECLSIAIQLIKEPVIIDGVQQLYAGFSIGGGIDQDFRQSPQNFNDAGIYVTAIDENSPSSKCGLQLRDKILSSNNYDFTTCTHTKAVAQLRKHPVLNLLIARKGVTHD